MANVTERTVTWNNVNWRKVHAQVRNLRQRIFRATREGNLKKVRSDALADAAEPLKHTRVNEEGYANKHWQAYCHQQIHTHYKSGKGEKQIPDQE